LRRATAIMTEATVFPFDLPADHRKKLTVDFDGGNQSSDAGLPLLRQAERTVGICRRLAKAMPDCRDQSRVWHQMLELVAARTFAIGRGYKDGNPRLATTGKRYLQCLFFRGRDHIDDGTA